MNNLGKAGTLVFLEKKQKKNNFIIPPFLRYSKKFYYINKKTIVKKILSKFSRQKIIIRSSSKNEDKINKSNAGKYDSYQLEKLSTFEIEKYSDKVLEKLKDNDEIIFQKYIAKSDYAGVIFTRELNSNLPYYSINLDYSGLTNVITSGVNSSKSKNIIVSRNYIHKSKYKNLLTTIKKIELLIKDDRLDIEFCVKKNKIFIFQCRPLKRIKNKVNDELVYGAIKNLENKFSNLHKSKINIPGKYTVFSNMSDWNPAEMIGIKPTLLSLSLYSELITDYIWSEQREAYLYQSSKPFPLMINFLGCPYIDLRVDFNSFLPKGLKNSIKTKIINHSLKKISQNPELHDKIEFNLIETFFDFDSTFRIRKILKNKDAKEYIKSLKKLTNNIFNSKLLDNDIEKISLLKKKQKFGIINKKTNIENIFLLINDCKTFGTLAFAGIARCAFVATKFLRSFVKLNILDENDYSLFFESINNVQKKINNSLLKKDKNLFFSEFGHLRPMTYSISSLNYREGFNDYFNLKNLRRKKINKFTISKLKKKKIDQLFIKNKINCDANRFFLFAKKAIYYREYSKLIFSKSIDLIFKELIHLGSKLDINRNELEYVSIKDIISYYNNLDVYKLKLIMKNNIQQNKKQYEITKNLEVPDFIKSKYDFYEFEKNVAKPNFVQLSEVTAKILDLTRFKSFKNINLDNKIILLESADPGYDFIFSSNIVGLITRYGGANSHMTIRCIDEGIPAAIGVGSLLYEKLKTSNIVNINAKQKTINIIN